MAGICTNQTRDGGAGCDHRTITVNLDGEPITLHETQEKLDSVNWDTGIAKEQLPAGWEFYSLKKLFVALGVLRLRKQGLAIDDFLNRVTNGDESTNMKHYFLLAKDVTKTNIGTAYVNVPPGANGEETLVEFTGCTEFRVKVHGILQGTGPYQMRIVRDSDDAVLYESGVIVAQAGPRRFDTGIQPLPAAASGFIDVRFQAKSGTATDDPQFQRCVLMVR